MQMMELTFANVMSNRIIGHQDFAGNNTAFAILFWNIFDNWWRLGIKLE